MKRITTIFFATCLAMPIVHVSPSSARAQDDIEDIEPEDDEEEATEPTESAEVAADDRVLPIRRGLFARGDFGAFFTIGGKDFRAADGAVSDNTVSNLQPLLGITVGYDVVQSPNINLALGARFATTFNASAAQIPGSTNNPATLPRDAQSFPGDFGIYEFGAAADLTIMASDRLGVLVHADGGMSLVRPDPSLPATSDAGTFVDGAGEATIGGIFSAGGGVEYYTLLTGVSVGFVAAFYGVITDDFIPGVGLYIPLKYNF
jgi:hypothetical protein